MTRKNNIRSIRFSDDLAELINQQAGRTFTEKFENLVTRCVWELPTKQQESQRLEKRIGEQRQQLREISQQARMLKTTVSGLLSKSLFKNF